MINFVVVDDNAVHRKRVVDSILKKMMNNLVEFNIVEFEDYSSKLLKFIDSEKRNCVYFLDLELPNGDGVDVARHIRYGCNNWTSPIIVVTTHTSMYYDIYRQRLQLFDFIGKDDDVEGLVAINVGVCLKMFNVESSYRYVYKGVDRTIPIDSIDYIIRDGRRAKMVASNDVYFQNVSIRELKSNFPDYFVTSSKGVVINLKNVSKIDWNDFKVYFKDGKSGYLVSYSHKKEIMQYELA